MGVLLAAEHVLAPDDPKWVHRDDELAPPTQAWVHRAHYVGPVGKRPADELHGIRPEQPELIIEQFRNAAAAAEPGDPDAPGAMQGFCRIRHRFGGDARNARGFRLELV